MAHTFEEFSSWYFSGATVDPSLAPYFLFLAAFSEGESSFTVPSFSKELQVMVWVIKQFLPIRITLTEKADGLGKVSVVNV